MTIIDYLLANKGQVLLSELHNQVRLDGPTVRFSFRRSVVLILTVASARFLEAIALTRRYRHID